MKPTLFSLLAILLLFTVAHAEETATPTPVAKNVSLKIQLLEIPTMLAIASGLDDATALEEDGAATTRFQVFHPAKPIGPSLSQVLADKNTKVLLEANLACSSGYPFALTQMKPAPAGSNVGPELAKPDSDHPQFPGMMGYFFRFTPSVGEKNYITMPMYMLLQAPGVRREVTGVGEVPTGMQAINTTLRMASATTVCVANVVPSDFRAALAISFKAAAAPGELPTFPAAEPTPGTTTYLLVTPTAIEDK